MIFFYCLVFIFSFASVSQAQASKINPIEQALVQSVHQGLPHSLQLLEKIVNINSGSLNPEGVKKVGLFLKKEFDNLGMSTQWIDLPKEFQRGGHLIAKTNGNQGPSILLIGHTDTVFEKESPFQKFERKGDVAKGPGVNDMKGGLIVILSVLQALKEVGSLEKSRITVILLGDEENGPTHDPKGLDRKHLIEIAKKSDVALGFEYAVDSINKATIARRSYTAWTVKVSATKGHSSKIFSKELGAGASFGLTHILNQFYIKLKGPKYLTINPGLLSSGSQIQEEEKGYTVLGKSNVVAQTAIAQGDLRAISPKQLAFAKKIMKQIINKPLPGTKASLTFGEGYPPMPPTQGNIHLLKILSQTSDDLGYGKISGLDPGKRGAADTSLVAPYIGSVIDGLGLLGEGAHSDKEQIDLKEMPKIINRTAIFVHRLIQMKPNQFKKSRKAKGLK